MSVTREEVERIAGLARLELGEEEAESLRNDLNGILEHMETLGQAGTTSGSGTGAPGSKPGEDAGSDGPGGRTDGEIEAPHRSGAAPLREDGVASPDPLSRSPEELAPEWDDGFFSVPRLPGLDEEGAP